MRKLRPSIAGFLALAVLAYLLLPLAAALPVTPEKQMPAKQTGWTGVVTIWLCETFYPGKGSFLGWLTRQARVFEAQNHGVLLKIDMVKPDIAYERISSGENLPDAIICGGGLFDGASMLVPAPESAARPVFANAVTSGGAAYGVPVAAGAYTILFNSQRLAKADTGAGREEFLRSLVISPANNRKAGASYAISCPQSKYISPSVGMLTMLDVPFAAADSLPPGFCKQDSATAWADFVLDKKSAGYVCTQKEVYRIRQLEAGGGAFAWQVYDTPATYTDQVLALYCFDSQNEDAAQRQEAAFRYARLLQSMAAQQKLADVGAFSVIGPGERLYPPGSAMGTMESGIMAEDLTVANQFDWLAQRLNLAAAEREAADPADALAAAANMLKAIKRGSQD